MVKTQNTLHVTQPWIGVLTPTLTVWSQAWGLTFLSPGELVFKRVVEMVLDIKWL